MVEWFEDESIWVGSCPTTFDSETVKAGEKQVEQIMELADYKSGEILDLACGVGRHAIPLAAKGHKVTGVDLTEFLLKQGKVAADKAGVDVEWIQEDMRRFVRPNTYSLAFCMYNSFGYFEEREDDFVVLAGVFESLKPGGAFVLECAGKEPLAGRFQAYTGFTKADGTQVFMTREIVADWTRTKNETLVIVGDRVKRFPYVLNLYSGHEIKELFKRAGFEVFVYGSLDAIPYDSNAKNLFAVGRKPGGSS